MRLENQDPDSLYELQTGLTGGAADYPNHLATYASERSDYTLGSAAELKVPLTWREGASRSPRPSPSGAASTPSALTTRCTTAAATPWEARPYAQILRNDPRTRASTSTSRATRSTGRRSTTAPSTASSTPPAPMTATCQLDVRDGWIAALQHHFVSAVVPPRGAPWHLHARHLRQPVPARRHRTGDQRRARRQRGFRAGAVRRTEAAGAAGCHLARARARGRLRAPVVPRAPAVPPARQGARAHRQLGHRDHRGDVLAEAAVLPALGGERPLDGEDEAPCSRASRTCRRPTPTTARSSGAR